MKTSRLLFCLLLLIALLPSCAIKTTYYAKHLKAWQTTQPEASAKVKYEVFLLGDAGETKENIDPVLSLLQSKLDKANANSAMIFLGDNIYHSGMPDTSAPDRKEAERRINAQLDMIKNFKGKPFFVPGNHDWGYNLQETHLQRVQREMEYVEKYTGRKDVYLPKNGCPGPATLQLNDDLTILAIDPNWLLGNGYRVGTKCDIKDEADFSKAIDDAVASAKGKNLIIAAHQPLFSTGPHNGTSTWKTHLFPMTDFNKYLYVPLPVLGSIYAAIRAGGLSRQDLHNSHYKNYIKTMLAATKGQANVVFAAGHDHTLEYFPHDENLQEVLSGAGCKKSNIKKSKSLGFGGHYNGFSIIKYYDNNEVWVEYWTPEGADAKNGTLLFRTRMYVKK